MNKTIKNEKKYNTILVIVVVIIVCIVALYTGFTNKYIEKNTRYTVQQTANKTANEVDIFIDSAISSIQLTSYNIASSMDKDFLDNPNETIRSMLYKTPFNFIEFIEKDGTNTTEMGEVFDASDRVYYKEGIKGNTGIWVNYKPKYSKEYLLNFYTPLVYNNEIVGVLTGTLGSETNFLPYIRNSFFGKDMVGIILDENGKIISSTEDISYNIELDEVLSKCGIGEKGRDLFNEQLTNYKESVFEFNKDNGKAIACISTNRTTGWKIIQIVPPESFKDVMKQNTKGAYFLIATVCGLLLIFLLYFLIDSQKNHSRLLKEKEKVVQNYEQILTATATDTYKAIRRVDMQTEQADYLYFEDYQVKQKHIGDWTNWFETQKNNIHPDDFERVKDFYSIKKLKSMKIGDTYKCDFRAAKKNNDGFYNTYATTISIVMNNDEKFALVTTIDSSSVVKHDLAQRRLLESSASIYHSMQVFDLKKDVIDVLKNTDAINSILKNQVNGVQFLLKKVMSTLTSDSDFAKMMEFIDLNTLDERMAGTNNITLEFLGKVSGWCRARFIAVEYDDDYKLSKVLWVIENIDAEKRRQNQLLYLSETDQMTGIRNRGSGENKIKQFIKTNHSGLFCIVDADGFKSINDTFGHFVGDKVIIAIADCLRNSFRDTDVIMRLGGDEFAVFADGVTDFEQALSLINRFFDNINNIDIPELGTRKIAVSLGATIKRSNDGLDFESLYHNADSATYSSKKKEGNAHTFFEQLQ